MLLVEVASSCFAQAGQIIWNKRQVNSCACVCVCVCLHRCRAGKCLPSHFSYNLISWLFMNACCFSILSLSLLFFCIYMFSATLYCHQRLFCFLSVLCFLFCFSIPLSKPYFCSVHQTVLTTIFVSLLLFPFFKFGLFPLVSYLLTYFSFAFLFLHPLALPVRSVWQVF